MSECEEAGGRPIVFWFHKTVTELGSPPVLVNEPEQSGGHYKPAYERGSSMTNAVEKVIGIDVSKLWVDVAVHGRDEVRRFANDVTGLGACREWLGGSKGSLVVMEATGRLHRLAEEVLGQAGHGVAVVNPARIRHFARAKGRLAKTDRTDAFVIAEYGVVMQPPPRLGLAAEIRALADLVARRRQLVDTLTAEKNRFQSMGLTPALKETFETIMRALVGCISDIERSINDLITSDQELKEKDRRLRSVPGIGPVCAQTLLSQMPELGRLTRKQIASLAGLAPVARDSGQFKGRRYIQGGRDNVRPVLYMATLAAIRCNPLIKAFYQRLRDQGKLPKVALTACMRKFIVILNALIRDNKSWEIQ